MILRDQCSFPLFEVCATLWWSCVWRDFQSDKRFALIAQKGIHFVVVVVHIHTNGTTAILILCFRFFVAFTFVIRIHITHKWNLSLSWGVYFKYLKYFLHEIGTTKWSTLSSLMQNITTNCFSTESDHMWWPNRHHICTMLPMLKIRSLIPRTYKIDSCCYLACWLALLE